MVRCVGAAGVAEAGLFAVVDCIDPWSCRIALHGWARSIAEATIGSQTSVGSRLAERTRRERVPDEKEEPGRSAPAAGSLSSCIAGLRALWAEVAAGSSSCCVGRVERAENVAGVASMQ